MLLSFCTRKTYLNSKWFTSSGSVHLLDIAFFFFPFIIFIRI